MAAGFGCAWPAASQSSVADRWATSLRNGSSEMEALEAGAIANADEKRMVGHYWLRAPELAPIERACAPAGVST